MLRRRKCNFICKQMNWASNNQCECRERVHIWWAWLDEISDKNGIESAWFGSHTGTLASWIVIWCRLCAITIQSTAIARHWSNEDPLLWNLAIENEHASKIMKFQWWQCESRCAKTNIPKQWTDSASKAPVRYFIPRLSGNCIRFCRLFGLKRHCSQNAHTHSHHLSNKNKSFFFDSFASLSASVSDSNSNCSLLSQSQQTHSIRMKTTTMTTKKNCRRNAKSKNVKQARINWKIKYLFSRFIAYSYRKWSDLKFRLTNNCDSCDIITYYSLALIIFFRFFLIIMTETVAAVTAAAPSEMQSMIKSVRSRSTIEFEFFVALLLSKVYSNP